MSAQDESIHPRFRHAEPRVGHTRRAKNKDVTQRKLAALEAHAERHPRDSFTQRHISTLRSAQ